MFRRSAVAARGVLFLDEVTEMTPAAQAKSCVCSRNVSSCDWEVRGQSWRHVVASVAATCVARLITSHQASERRLACLHGGHPQSVVWDGDLPLVRTSVYRSVAAPVNAELTRHVRAGSVPANARALHARWDSVIVLRVLLMGLVVVALAAALVRSAQRSAVGAA
jgi:hypothetical protein